MDRRRWTVTNRAIRYEWLKAPCADSSCGPPVQTM